MAGADGQADGAGGAPPSDKADHARRRRAEGARNRRLRTRAAIVAAAFDLFGRESGPFLSVDEIAARAGVTRATFYNHFAGLPELHEAVSHELVDDFVARTIAMLAPMRNPARRAAAAIRAYLEQARADPRWAWSIINLSSSGMSFDAATFRAAGQTIAEGMRQGRFTLPTPSIGRDLVLGTVLAAMATQLREATAEDYPALVARHILLALGVPAAEAMRFAEGTTDADDE